MAQQSLCGENQLSGAGHAFQMKICVKSWHKCSSEMRDQHLTPVFLRISFAGVGVHREFSEVYIDGGMHTDTTGYGRGYAS